MLFVKKDIFKEIKCLSLQKKLFKAIRKEPDYEISFLRTNMSKETTVPLYLKNNKRGFTRI